MLYERRVNKTWQLSKCFRSFAIKASRGSNWTRPWCCLRLWPVDGLSSSPQYMISFFFHPVGGYWLIGWLSWINSLGLIIYSSDGSAVCMQERRVNTTWKCFPSSMATFINGEKSTTSPPVQIRFLDRFLFISMKINSHFSELDYD